MSDVLIIALLSFCGTLVGTFGGVVTGSKLMTYRIEQLEKKVEKQTKVADRVTELEKLDAVKEGEPTSLDDTEYFKGGVTDG